MFLGDENEWHSETVTMMVAGHSSGSFFFFLFLSLDILLHLSYTLRSIQRSEVRLSPTQRHHGKANTCYHIIRRLNQLFKARIWFPCQSAALLHQSTKILHLTGTMKEIINLWMNVWEKSKHFFLICSDKTFPPGVNICSRNSQNRTQSIPSDNLPQLRRTLWWNAINGLLMS